MKHFLITLCLTVSFAKASEPRKLLVARGFEPGWYAEFFENKVRFIYNYGKDSLHIDFNFTGINAQKKYNKTVVGVKTPHQTNGVPKFVVSILQKNCFEAGSGEKRDRVITISYNGKTYKGCATSNF
ncbi:MAG: hypothetical protein JSU07_08870 [Bacteroidetes bacterium]|nr:hypothetical protein [Bacteroidota bacterium]